MADRDRHDWDRGRDYGDRDREYGRGGDRDRNEHDRGMVSRGADEVRSWFGDDDARRRREMDEQRERQGGGRDYGANSERARSEHGWQRQDYRPDQQQGYRPDQQWESGRTSQQGGFGERQYSPRGQEWDDPRYNAGGPTWTGGSRDYGDEDSRRQGNWRYTGGNYAAGQTNRSFSGGYGAGNYESGNYGASFRSGSSGSNYSGGSSGSGSYGRDFGSTGEGRWSGQQPGNRSSSESASYWGVTGGMFAGRGPRNYQRSDDRIREDVNERLTADPRVDASDIDVRVQNCEVTLSGTVEDGRTRRLAEEIVEDLPGVRDVRNELRVNRRGQWGNQDQHRQVGEQSRGREDGAIGHTGDPQKRDDVTTINTKDTTKR